MNAKRELQKENPSEQELIHYLRNSDPVKASAETNSLFRLLQEEDKILFFHSETDEGRLCAKTLQTHYSNHRNHPAECFEIKHLNYQEKAFKMRGLRNLVATLIENIRKEQQAGREVLFNATGGFKAEIAFATLIGLVFNIPVYYIHEAFRDIIEMPPTPVGWDFNLIAEHEEFFEWLNADLRTTEEVEKQIVNFEKRIGHFLEGPKLRMLLVEEEEYTMLAPTGEVFWKAYTDLLDRYAGVPVKLSSNAQKKYDDSDPETRKLFDRTFRKLQAPQLRQTHSDRVNNSDCLVFPKGHRDERVFWYENDGIVYVCEIALHSDNSYKALLDRGVRKQKYTEWHGAPSPF